jgi:hypothetical protein
MTTEHLESLGLDPDQVDNTVRFHQAYAATAVAELESTDSDDPDLMFTLRADAATALREAGQWALLLDPAPAVPLLRQAGTRFFELGQAFGSFLEVLAGGPRRDANSFVLGKALRDMSDVPRDDDYGPEDEYQPMPEIHLQQQQQAYLVMAASAVATADQAPDERGLGSVLLENLETSPHNTGVLPVGSLGTPIHRFWSVARHLLGSSGRDVFEIARHLVAMCQSYEETISLARANDYLWRNGAAPVDIADLDIAGIAALTTRRFDRDRLQGALADATLGRGLGAIAMVPVELGMSLAGR